MSWEISNQETCEGKKAFLTWKQAQTHNHMISRRGSAVRAKGKKIEKLHVYKCKKCGMFHLGHAAIQHRPRQYWKRPSGGHRTEE